MSEIKSLDTLREELEVCGCDPDKCISCSVPRKVRDGLVEVEAEIEERYMLLPLDADGVPIRVGDEIQQLNHAGVWTDAMPVIAVVDESCCFALAHGLACEARTYVWGNNCRHARPRTVEDVLCDVWKEAIDYAKSDMWRNPDEVFAERADEIREIIGGGE